MQRDKEKEEEETNRKISVKGKCVFSCMCFFNGVCREIERVQIEFLQCFSLAALVRKTSSSDP